MRISWDINVDTSDLRDLDLNTYGFEVLARLARRYAKERGYEELTPDEEKRVAKARTGINEFVEYVFTDERQRPIRQEWFHREWQHHASTHRRLVLWAPVEHGKSKQLTIFRTLWILGNNPDALIAIISETAKGKAYKFLEEVKQHVTNNVRLHRVFPGLKRGRFWRDNEIAVERTIIDRNPSVQALGVLGPINGARLTHVVMDDVLSFDNTYSRLRRIKVREWVENEVLSRLLPDDEAGEDGDAVRSDSFLMVGTAWHAEDAMHAFAGRERFKALRYSAIECEIEEVRNPTDTTEKKILSDRWPLVRLQNRLADVGTVAFSRQMLNRTRDEETAYFSDAWIDRGLDKGKGYRLEHTYQRRRGELIEIGVDLATGEKASADRNVFCALLFSSGVYRILWIESDEAGRWSPDEKVKLVESYDRRYDRPTFQVESNLGQMHFVQFTQARLPESRIHAVHTGEEKRHPVYGVEGIAVALERGEFAIPNDGGTLDPELAALVQDMRDFDPADRHIPDRLAALWLAFTAIRRRRLPQWQSDGQRDRQDKKRKLRRLDRLHMEH